jgi:GDP-4-dehydro-6-deoxy-D-mannose reductase
LRALITGANGFAGSHLAEYLLEHTDVAPYGLGLGGQEHIAHLEDKLIFYEGDLRDPEQVKEVLAEVRPDLIFHLAAQAYVGVSWKDPWATLANNIHAQLNVLQGMVDLSLPAKVMVVGSNEEYGLVKPGEMPVKETNPLRPDNPYGVSKIGQDMLGLQYYNSYGLHVVRVRPFNHIGPRQSDQFVASAFARQIAEAELGLREAVIHVGNLSTQRDFTDVRDVVRAYYLVLTKGRAGEVYNIGSGVPRLIGDLLDTLLKWGELDIRVEVDPSRLRPSDVPIIYCDPTKLKACTGWEPTTTFEQSLHDVLEYWRERIRRDTDSPNWQQEAQSN